MQSQPITPLVSIVITCYNHAQFLPESIGSVRLQSYKNIEVLLVDDGSTDGTNEIAKQYPEVHYIHQTNSGLSVARNTGLQHATGEFILFLDADDALLPDGVSAQVAHMLAHPNAAFVSGGHVIADAQLRPQRTVTARVFKEHYHTLLSRNYIGMHAAVLYRRALLEHYGFDTALRACEDYDLYLRMSRDHPIFSHTEPIALYRTMTSGMSGNLPNMLQMSLAALNKQKPVLHCAASRIAFRKGQNNWRNLYGYAMANLLEDGIQNPKKNKYLKTLLWYKPKLFIRFYIKQMLRLSKL